ncbi:MAG: carboxypeptidase regulatory-like domain-containing protein [Bryobacteraceae bacterium]|jgi:Carboxypeptidase regulatory-like domain
MRPFWVLWLLWFPSAALACKCAAPFPVCQRVALSDIVFVGTVESIAPHFLDYWNPTQQQSLTLLNAETARTQADRSAASLAAAKSAYAAIFPDLPDDSKKLLEGAKSREDLVKAFYRILGNGRRVRFRIKEAYRGDEDEDETLDVWTPFGDCGVDFQTGETYLVYADDDEESSSVSTDTCSGTKRLSDAGSDLAYLYFFENNGDDSARLDGFATTNQFHQLDAAHVEAPVAGVVVELKSPSGSRFTETAADGKFVFDGLPAGEYTVAAYAAGYPKNVQQLAAPQRVRIEAKTCAAATLLIFKPPEQ